MTHKEKAKELVDRFTDYADSFECEVFTSDENQLKNAKQCASICVDEIIKALKDNHDYSKSVSVEFTYWQEVKNEIPHYEMP